ncbi:hypothetical protein NOV72_03288 [Caballeronia novacaledonica]|uniref:Uncharacterized protein n=1 Tax=Caballeronia novacaledonica TaxID=1544861 RepID=A0A2U3I7H4_9BURK|nr:hypothetical protein [Caballeronia novacaledonica]SPB16088.1 hypothetical protein NOV72_03288 [Caballeronia novacaledonica]
MCTDYSPACTCYRDAREYQREQTRQAVGSRIEHAVLALLDNPAALVASALAVRLADLIRAQLDDGERVSDLLVTHHGGAFFWLEGDGAQHHARFDDAVNAAPIRLVA